MIWSFLLQSSLHVCLFLIWMNLIRRTVNQLGFFFLFGWIGIILWSKIILNIVWKFSCYWLFISWDFFYKTHPIQFSLFPNHLLPKLIGCVGLCPCNEQNWKPITHAALFQVWLNMAQWFRCIWECKKQTDKRTDRWCRREYQKSSHRILFKWAKKNPINFIECYGWYYEVTSNDFTRSMICQVNI